MGPSLTLRIWSAVVLLVTGGAMAPAYAQDVRRGEYVFRKCLLCHVTNPGAKDLLAPPLHNIVGRRAAQISGFEYSEIMRLAGQKGLYWSPEALNYFLDRPEEFMPGTYMAFSGLDDQERRDVIAYLEKITLDNRRAEQIKRRQQLPPAPTGPGTPQQRSFAPTTPIR